MGQRVTNSMMVMNFNRNLNKSNTAMMKYQSQLATNKRIVRLSDDPIGVIKSVNARGKIADIEQFKRNITDAQSWLTSSETALNEVNEIMKRVNELAVQATTDTMSADDRAAIGYEIDQLREQIVTVANSTLGDKFVFGDFNVSKAPFVADPDTGDVEFNGDSLLSGSIDPFTIDYEIGVANIFTVGMEGATMMGMGEDKNIYFQMTQFLNELNNPESNYGSLEGFVDKFQELQRDVLAQLSDIGGRMNRLDMMSQRYEQDTINYTQMQSDVEDLDQAEAIMYFSMQEAVYRAALSVGGRVLPPTLMDFLR